ncbi:MAG: ATP-binding cassette domain-containing protein [Crocinitomicaceae bacterium]
MLISFQSVIPKPLENADLSASEVWNSLFKISESGHYIINASSGKGKSTFTNILYGLRHDYKGQVQLNGRDISTFEINEWANLRKNELAVVFQGLELFPNISVVDNILLKNRLTDYKTEAEIKLFLQTLEIDKFSNNFAGTLSMGQQQRVAIARSLCQPFKCLLLDEPFSHLDMANKKRAWQLIDEESTSQGAKTITTSLGDNFGIVPVKTFRL